MEPPKYLGDPNPAVKVTILFEQGNGLVWKLEKPWDQARMFMEIGFLAKEYELGIEFEFPVGDGMDLVPEEDDEFGGAIYPPAADQEGERVSLDEDSFKKLVAGEELVQGTARIILTDIGWGVMESAIRSARLASHD